MKNIETRLRDYILQKVEELSSQSGRNIGDVDDDFNLLQSGLIDSLAFLELVMTVEKEFDLEIDFSDLDPTEFTTLGGLVRFCVGANVSMA